LKETNSIKEDVNMNRLLKISLMVSLSLVFVYGDSDSQTHMEEAKSVKQVIASGGHLDLKEVSIVNNFKHMFEDGHVVGQVRFIYSDRDLKTGTEIIKIVI